MKKGFTLIELLAVIVVLALILLIAVPMVLGIIEKAKKGALESDALLIIDTVKKKKIIDDMFSYTDISIATIEEKLGVKPDNYNSITVTDDNGKPKIIIEGKDKYDGYTVYGTTDNIRVVKTEDYDGTIPVITLLGDNPFDLMIGTTFTDPGVTATDNKDGDITGNVVVSGTVNKDVLGTYTLTYNVSDAAGNNAVSVTRTVKVVPPLAVRFGGSGDDRFHDGVKTTDGYVAVGFSNSNDGDLATLSRGANDAIIVKVDNSGNVIWKNNFGGTADEYFTSINKVSNGYIVTGRSASTNGDMTAFNYGSWDAILIKYDTYGNISWKKHYGGTGVDMFYDAVPVSDGYIVVGESDSTTNDLVGLNKGGRDAIIVKYDLDGNLVWKKNLGGTDLDSFQRVTFDGSNIVAIGISYSTNGDLASKNKGQYDAIIVKYDSNGSSAVIKNFGGVNYDAFTDVTSVTDGYVVLGYSNSFDYDLSGLNYSGYDSIIVKYNYNLDVVWKKHFGGSSSDEFKGITINNNHIIAVGNSQSSDYDLSGNNGTADSTYVKYDLSGNLISGKTTGGNSGDDFSKVIPINNGCIAVGYSASSDWSTIGTPKGANDAILLHINP